MDISGFIESVKKVKAKAVAEGTVVRWKSSIYSYAAIYAGGKWWITGAGKYYGDNVFDNDEFVNDVLKDATSIEVATEFEEIA